MHAWRFGLPQDPKAWIIRAARNRAIDIIRREQRHRSFLPELATATALAGTIEAALAPAAESASQLAMMFAVCDPGLNRETHVTLILRWLCGLSPKEIGQAFLVDTQTIDRRLHRGRGRLRATAVPGRGHLRARPQAHRPEEAGKRVGDPHLCARLTSVRYPKRAESCGRAER